jgi:hypothetical protein
MTKGITRRHPRDNVVSIVPVNNLRYSVEGYVERRHPEFAYDTGLNRFFADFIDVRWLTTSVRSTRPWRSGRVP